MIEKLNSALNLLCFLLIIFGGILALRNPEVGKSIIEIAAGALGGVAIRHAALTPNQAAPTAEGQKEAL